MKTKGKKIYEITWVDAAGYARWINLEDAPKDPLPTVSVGYLLEDTPEKITIHQSFCEQNNNGDHFLTIPKGMFVKKRLLK